MLRDRQIQEIADLLRTETAEELLAQIFGILIRDRGTDDRRKKLRQDGVHFPLVCVLANLHLAKQCAHPFRRGMIQMQAAAKIYRAVIRDMHTSRKRIQIHLRILGADVQAAAAQILHEGVPVLVCDLDAEGQRRRAACMGGLLSVLDGEVRLVATTWEWAEEIDQARAEASKKRAEEILAQKNLDKRDYELAQARLKRALVRTSIH